MGGGEEIHPLTDLGFSDVCLLDFVVYKCWCSCVCRAATDRPQRLAVIINPNSGKKQAEKVFFSKVQPLFKLCGIDTKVIGELLTHSLSALNTLFFVVITLRPLTDTVLGCWAKGTYIFIQAS